MVDQPQTCCSELEGQERRRNKEGSNSPKEVMPGIRTEIMYNSWSVRFRYTTRFL